MTDQTNEDLPSAIELCEKIELLMKAEFLSDEEKAALAAKVIEIARRAKDGETQ